MNDEHTAWLRRNHGLLTRTLPARIILQELVANYVFSVGSEEYENIVGPQGEPASEALLAELVAKSSNAFLYFIRAMNKTCPEVLIACEPTADTQRYVVSIMDDNERLSLALAFHWKGLLENHAAAAVP